MKWVHSGKKFKRHGSRAPNNEDMLTKSSTTHFSLVPTLNHVMCLYHLAHHVASHAPLMVLSLQWRSQMALCKSSKWKEDPQPLLRYDAYIMDMTKDRNHAGFLHPGVIAMLCTPKKGPCAVPKMLVISMMYVIWSSNLYLVCNCHCLLVLVRWP